MKFGLTNVPNMFMRLKNEVLKTYQRKFTIVYLDNIMIFSRSKKEHFSHLQQVLHRLSQKNMVVNLQKCSFMQKELVYLGYRISSQGLKMNLEKVKIIIECPKSMSAI